MCKKLTVHLLIPTLKWRTHATVHLCNYPDGKLCEWIKNTSVKSLKLKIQYLYNQPEPEVCTRIEHSGKMIASEIFWYCKASFTAKINSSALLSEKSKTSPLALLRKHRSVIFYFADF